MRHITRSGSAWTVGTFAVASLAGAVVASAGAALAIAVPVTLAVAMPAIVKTARRRPAEPEPEGPVTLEVPRDSKRSWMPLRVALVWLIGTYAAFWTTGISAKVDDPMQLHMFIAATVGTFTLGYAIYIKRCPKTFTVPENRWDNIVAGRRLVLAGAGYLAVFGAIQIVEFGATSVGSVLSRIQTPASAYQAKFGVYAVQQAVERVSAPMQVVTLAGVLYGVAAPLLVVYWRQLSLAFRLAGIAGLTIYGLFFLFIGTQKGLGDIVVMLLAGALAGTGGTWWTRRAAGSGSRRALRYAALALVAFLVYMISAQAGRAQEFGTRHITPPSPVIAAVIGDDLATGVAATLFYPTHGYLGLSYNLETPFAWSGGLGSSSVVASYAAQYFGVAAPDTYPVRTENRTGWPAKMYWATAYPWLASDLTFPGVIVLMGLFGWLFARMWIEGAIMRDNLALVIFGQLAIAVAYIPANNQLWISRPTTIGFVTLLLIYVVRAIRRSARKAEPVTVRQWLPPANTVTSK